MIAKLKVAIVGRGNRFYQLAMHMEVALACMKAGVAVGGIHNVDDCLKLVERYEQTKTPFMFLENCCFCKHEMLATSLVRNGKMGKVSYCRDYYCHD